MRAARLKMRLSGSSNRAVSCPTPWRTVIQSSRTDFSPGKLRTDEVWITSTEAPNRVEVSDGCWYARRYHSSVILPSDILPTTVEPHNKRRHYRLNRSAETDLRSCRGPLGASRSCRRPFHTPRQHKAILTRGAATTQPVMVWPPNLKRPSPQAWLQSWHSIAEKHSCGGPQRFLFGG